MYNIEGLEWFRTYAGELKGKHVLELGNQHIWVHAQTRCNAPFNVARDWFKSLGVAEYASIDMNGEDGALKLDLSQAIDKPEWANHFDVVTNIGTLEHVEGPSFQPLQGQYEALKTMHEFCAIGGRMIHQLPPVGQWLDHCRIRYKPNFGKGLAGLCWYELFGDEKVNLATLGGHVDYFCVTLKKNLDNEFTNRVQDVIALCEWT